VPFSAGLDADCFVN